MKILNKIDVSDWSYKHHCEQCDSDLEVDKTDLLRYYGGPRDGDSFCANCMVCGGRFYISEKIIPKLIKLEIKNQLIVEQYYGR